MNAPDLSDEVKGYIFARVLELFSEYAAMPGSSVPAPAIRWLAEYGSAGTTATSVRNAEVDFVYNAF